MNHQFPSGPAVTRRKLLSTTAAAAAAISAMRMMDALASPNPAASPAFSRWQAGTNSFVLPVNGDPYRWPFAPAIPNILFNKTVYSGLIKYDLDGVTPIPDLATEWTTEDAITWTFTLRDDVTWHDGTPFTADDVKFTFDAMLDPNNTVTNRGVLVTLTSTEVVDPKTVKLTFSEPVASLPVGLGYLIFILPKHLLEGTDLNNPVDFVANPVGTGPFMFKEFVSGDHTTVVPNPNYFGQVAQVDAVIFKQVPDLNTQMLQIRTGELDVAFPEVQQLDAIKDVDTVTVTTSTPIQYFFIGFNNRLPMFQDKLVRQGLAHAVDRQAIVDVVIQGNATLATGPINPAIAWAYNPNVTTYDYDEDKAKELLGQAGWTAGSDGILEKDGEKLSFTIYSTAGNSTREQINTALQQYFAVVGADAKLEFLEPNVFDQHMFEFDFDALMHFSTLQPDPDLINYYGTDRGNNYFGYSNPEVDDLLAQGRATVDQDERATIYAKFQEILADDLPVVFFYYPHEIDVINNRVVNYPPLDFRNATLYLNQITLSDAS